MLIVTTIMENFQNEFICYLQLFSVQSPKPSLLLLICLALVGLKYGLSQVCGDYKV